MRIIRSIEVVVGVLAVLAMAPGTLAQSVTGTVVDEQNSRVSVPVLVELRDAATDSVIASTWTGADGRFSLVHETEGQRLRLVATRFGSMATYSVQSILELTRDRSVNVVLPEPQAEAVPIPESSRYHDKNRALAEGMLTNPRMEALDSGPVSYSVFEATNATGAARFEIAELDQPIEINLHPLDDGIEATNGRWWAIVCKPDRACFATVDPGQRYELIVEGRPVALPPDTLQVSLPAGLTTIRMGPR